MISIRNECKDPHFNLALEEYVFYNFDPSEEYVILWQNEPSVIIGRNQNTIEEINAKFIKENNIHVVRRMSGGGAVYHDLGNLNFTFIVNSDQDVASNFRKFTEPVVSALDKLGVKAEFSGRNDITIDGRKFSGNAQHYSKNRLLHHGTILFDSDLTVVQEALNVKIDKLQSKGVKSVRSRVTNVAPYLKEKITVEEFKDVLLKFILNDEHYKDKEYILTEADLAAVRALMEKKYLTWEWNYGESPAFEIEKSRRFDGGNLSLKFNVEDGYLIDLKIYGDFFGKKDPADIEKLLKNQLYQDESIRRLLKSIDDFNEYFSGITIDNFIECMFY
ncbi:MAG TPA: lipoate--protein ligase [Clostridiales bacterium]|nr:lipoate--protein ligase [Clostridiales bacterium]